MCKLLELSPSSYYRHLKRARAEGKPPLLAEIEQICGEFTSYGYRMVTEELKRRGYAVNHKRVYKLMRTHGLTKKRRRRFVKTTDSTHSYPRYPNLARGFRPSGPNQLWQADLTYIRLQWEFCYLACILDAFSRRVVGWALRATLHRELALAALRMALVRRLPQPGFIHHSDQGVQYAAEEYVALLGEHGAQISMSRTGNPYDNALAESFMATLKKEEVYLQEYLDLADAQHQIGHFIEDVYNRKRLHSSLGYRPPVEFEVEWAAKELLALGA
jgi:transposase InsO family protein